VTGRLPVNSVVGRHIAHSPFLITPLLAYSRRTGRALLSLRVIGSRHGHAHKLLHVAPHLLL
jgi:hypothetical protein